MLDEEKVRAGWDVVWGGMVWDGKSVELAGGEEALSGGEEMGEFDDKGARMPDDRGKEIGVSEDDDGGEEAGVFDERGGEELGVFDKRGGKYVGMLDDDVNEVGVWGCEDGTEVDDTSVDTEEAGGLPDDVVGKIHWPKRSTPRGHVTVGEEDGCEG